MGPSFVEIFSSIALRNQKIWNFLCLQVKILLYLTSLIFFWKNHQISCFWARKFYWCTIKTQNSTGNSFLTLLERLENCFASKLLLFCEKMCIFWLSHTYRSQIWFYKEYWFIRIAERSRAEILLASRPGLVLLSVQLQPENSLHSKVLVIFVLDLGPADEP